MDFNIRKPGNIFALLLVLLSFLILIGLPLFTFFSPIALESESTFDIQDPNLPETFRLFLQVFIVALQIFLFVVFMIFVPIIWYIVVNKLSFKEIKSRLNLDFKNFDKAVLWGLLTVFLIYFVSILMSGLIHLLGYDLNQMSNVGDIERIFGSSIAIFIIIAFQPIGEEIFFRGFLLDKFNYIFNRKKIDEESLIYKYKFPAVFVTSLLFGVAHMSYGKPYVFLMTFVFGMILGLAVVKTKNLYTSIIAHMLLNIVTFVIYFSFKDILGF
jgi:membrane protease YdiL (CAAX protease family)